MKQSQPAGTRVQMHVQQHQPQPQCSVATPRPPPPAPPSPCGSTNGTNVRMQYRVEEPQSTAAGGSRQVVLAQPRRFGVPRGLMITAYQPPPQQHSRQLPRPMDWAASGQPFAAGVPPPGWRAGAQQQQQPGPPPYGVDAIADGYAAVTEFVAAQTRALRSAISTIETQRQAMQQLAHDAHHEMGERMHVEAALHLVQERQWEQQQLQQQQQPPPPPDSPPYSPTEYL